MGMDNVTFQTKAFTSRNPALAALALDRMLKLLYDLDVDFLREYPSTPPLYDWRSNGAPIVYREEPRGEEKWKDIPTIYSDGFGDCEDLACARAAELTMGGISSVPFSVLRQYGNIGVYHILVRRSDGYTEDPSYALGMRPKYRQATDPNSNGQIWRS